MIVQNLAKRCNPHVFVDLYLVTKLALSIELGRLRRTESLGAEHVPVNVVPAVTAAHNSIQIDSDRSAIGYVKLTVDLLRVGTAKDFFRTDVRVFVTCG